MAHLQEAVLGSLLLSAAYCDIRTRKIPNIFIVTGWLFGIAFGFEKRGVSGMMSGVVSAVIVILLGFFLFHMGMIGAGDVKLFSVVSCMQTVDRLFRILVVFFAVTGSMSLWKLVKNRLLAKRFCYFWRYVTGQEERSVYYEQKQDGTACTILLAPAIAGAYFLVLAAEQMGVI